MKIYNNFSFIYEFKMMPRHEHLVSDAFCTVDLSGD